VHGGVWRRARHQPRGDGVQLHHHCAGGERVCLLHGPPGPAAGQPDRRWGGDRGWAGGWGILGWGWGWGLPAVDGGRLVLPELLQGVESSGQGGQAALLLHL
jgi:hypothetical protein